MTIYGNAPTRGVNTKRDLGKTTNLHYFVILGATLHKEDIEKDW